MSRFRKSGADGASALLQRASSQLRGEKPQEDDDEGLGAYLSGLNKGSAVKYKSQQASIDWDKFDELSDKSVSDDDRVKQAAQRETPGSKFLKKKPQAAVETNYVKKNTGQTKSSALSKASAVATAYESKPRPELIRMLSDSDMDMSLDTETGPIQFGDAASLIPATKPRSRSRTPEKSEGSDSMGIGKGGARFMKKPARASPRASPKASPKTTKAPPPQPVKTEAKPQQKPPQKSQFHVPFMDKKPKPAYAQEDTDSSSMSIGKGGAKFLKKKSNAPLPEKIDSPKSPRVKKTKVNKQLQGKRRDEFTLKSSLKYGTEPQLDSSDESMANYIDALDGSSGRSAEKQAQVRPAKGKRTPRTQSRSATLLDEIKEEEENKMDATMSSDDSFKESASYTSDSLASTVLHVDQEDTSFCEDAVNVFDVDALEPLGLVSSFDADAQDIGRKTPDSPTTPRHSSPKPRGQKSKSKTKAKVKKQTAVSSDEDFFANFGLQTVEDLLGKVPSDAEDGQIVSEIGTDIEDESRNERSSSPLRSALKNDKTPRSSRSRVHYSLEEITEVRSRSPSPEGVSTRLSKSESAIYTEDFDQDSIRSESTIRTEQPASEIESITEQIQTARSSARTRLYSDDFVSVTESKWSSSRRDLRRAESSEAYYSDTFSELSDSQATDTVRKSRDRTKKKSVEVQTHVEPGDLVYQWDSHFMGRPIVPPGLGLGSVDPSPIATHVVSADQLETLTAYSPSVIALNEMLRQQIQLTENFIAIQQHLNQNLIAHAQPDYSYTTLQDTKRYIAKHRKPRLTFDEALRQVKDDMGLS